jgi:hypothetical protein
VWRRAVWCNGVWHRAVCLCRNEWLEPVREELEFCPYGVGSLLHVCMVFNHPAFLSLARQVNNSEVLCYWTVLTAFTL